VEFANALRRTGVQREERDKGSRMGTERVAPTPSRSVVPLASRAGCQSSAGQGGGNRGARTEANGGERRRRGMVGWCTGGRRGGRKGKGKKAKLHPAGGGGPGGGDGGRLNPPARRCGTAYLQQPPSCFFSVEALRSKVSGINTGFCCASCASAFFAMVWNACSTLSASFALVSK